MRKDIEKMIKTELMALTRPGWSYHPPVYDEQGNVIRYTESDGSVYATTNEYNEKGLLVLQENFDAEGGFVNRTSFEYDEEGNLKRSTYMDLNNTTAVTSYNYELMFNPDIAQ